MMMMKTILGTILLVLATTGEGKGAMKLKEALADTTTMTRMITMMRMRIVKRPVITKKTNSRCKFFYNFIASMSQLLHESSSPS